MKAVSGVLIKELRQELNLSQELFAEKVAISTRHLSRIENNKVDIDVFYFINIMNIFEKSMADFWLLFLDSNEYRRYEMYDHLLYSFSKENWADFNTTISELKEDSMLDSPHIKQILAYAEIIKAETSRGSSLQDFNAYDLEKMYNAIKITIPDFEEENVSEYLLTQNEIYLIGDICDALAGLKQHKRAIKLAKALSKNKSIKARLSEDKGDYGYIYAVGSLIACYESAKMYNEALDEAIKLHKYCVKENELTSIDVYLESIASSYKSLGEEESFYKSYLIRSYHWAVLRGYERNIAYIERAAKEKYHVSLEDNM